jgi:4-aminobutyrate aminotransferase-like enzyme
VLRFTPPLTIDARTIDEALELLARAASTLEPPA